MLFLGTTFFGARYTLDPSPTMAKNIKKIYIENGAFDQLFVSKNPDLKVENVYDEWDYDTILNAKFDDKTVNAGNSGFSLSNTDYVLIKCREVGTFNWIPLYAIKIEKIEDFKVSKKDFFRPSNKDYEYMVVSVCNGIENTYTTETIHSEFNGMYVCDKDNIYGTLYNMDDLDSTRPSSSSTLSLYNSRYPCVTSNSISNYEQGSIAGDFIKFDQENLEIDISGGIDYRNNIKDWLFNRKPKILKFYDGRIWLISVSGDISDTTDGHNNLRKIGFDWVEIGNVNDAETLYDCGLSDVGKEWWY